MKHYKDSNNNFYGIEDGQTVPAGLTEVTVEEINVYHASLPKTAEQVKAEAQSYLVSTDWYVTRLTETGKAIPEDVLIKRAEARGML